MNKKLIIAIGLAALIIIAIILILFVSVKPGEKENTENIPGINITYDNIEQILSGSDLAQNLPANAVLLLRFYNFDSGERDWEKSYIIQKGLVKEGISDACILLNRIKF